ncbi:MAG: rhamnulokinase [Desulfitobacteriaceae bacterium]
MGEWRGFAVDLGASNGRTVLGKYDGDKLELQEVTRFPNIPVSLNGTMHWNFLGLYHEVLMGLGKVCASGKYPATVGVDSWAVDFGLLDSHGELIGNPRHYRDHHNDGMMQEVLARVSPEKVYALTGIQTIQINTIYQLMYLHLYRPELLERSQHLLLIPDLITYFLTGVRASEFTNVTTTQLFNPRSGTWSLELISQLGLPERLFGSIVRPLETLGSIREGLIGAGCHQKIKVVTVGEHDTASAVFAIPHEAGDFAYISSGTWSLVGIISPKPIISEEIRQLNFTNEGGINGDYRVLKNVMGLWLLQEVKRQLDQNGESKSFADLVQMAEKAKPLQAVIDPDDAAFLAPENMITALQTYCQRTGQSPPIGLGEISRVILESLALKYRWVIETLEAITGRSLSMIHIVGGGVYNETLCQWTADAANRPVLAGPAEATVIGNLSAQLIVAGELSGTTDVPALVKRSYETKRYEPKPDRAIWDEGYATLLKLL